MIIEDKNIKFIFYLEGNKYIVFSLKENIELGDDLYFAKEMENGKYESVPDEEYEWVLNEYKGYLVGVKEEEAYEN